MDHNLDESLNLESTMGVDFEQPGDIIVSNASGSLDNTHEQDIPMEFESIEDQPMLIDPASEEVIVPDLMGDHFSLSDYTISDHQTSATSTIVDSNTTTTIAQSESMVDFHFDPHTQEIKFEPRIVEVKTTAPQSRPNTSKKNEPILLATMPRQIAIAPKPPQKVNIQKKPIQKTSFTTNQFAIAPKPSAVGGNKSVSLVKKVPFSNVIQGKLKGNTVLGQLGKQIIMMPAATGGTQKIKVITSSGGVPNIQYIRTSSDQPQLIPAKGVKTNQSVKPVVAKLITVQGQQNYDASNQPAVITKLFPASSNTTAQTRVVTMQQKTVPISIGDKVFISSPSKQAVSGNKAHDIYTLASPTKQLVNIGKSQDNMFTIKTSSKLVAAASQAPTTKKVLITANPKAKSAVHQTLQAATKETNAIGQRTQIHQVNVPGKGIQYIKLITPPPAKTVYVKPSTPSATVPKTFVFTDSKGNLIPMREIADKVANDQPPPLVMTGKGGLKKVQNAQHKLVRIAPVASKTQAITQSSARSSQSLLAPLSPQEEPRAVFTKIEVVENNQPFVETIECHEVPKSKATLQALIADAVDSVGEMEHDYTQTQTTLPSNDEEVHFEIQESSIDNENSMDQNDSSSKSDDPPLIVIPSHFAKQEPEDSPQYDESRHFDSLIDIQVENLNTYEQMRSPKATSDSEMVQTDLGPRPRKACNCTKSQCLKLYCDCFANGEFCHQCNCTNCFNNLINEELRQKAIRGCLDRNPNAFRPKIGKAKLGGPEIIRRHNKGCNCKRSGCLKNYCECYEAKIACSAICKCVGCRNVEETLERGRRRDHTPRASMLASARTPRTPLAPQGLHDLPLTVNRQPCSFITNDVIEAVCTCLLAAAVEGSSAKDGDAKREEGDAAEREEGEADPVRDVIEEFARCLQDIISAAQHASLQD